MPEGTRQACPACGIMVMVGYAKCPKCHAPMPAAAQRAKRASVQGGGTTSEPIERIDAVAAGTGWIWAIAGIVLVAAVIVWATQFRGGSTTRPTEAAAPVESGPAAGVEPPPPPPPDELPPPTLQNRPDPVYVADALEGELSVERLFATVEVTEDLLDVRSAFCADPRFSEITARHIADLKAAGLVRIRCSETHGEQVFERPL